MSKEKQQTQFLYRSEEYWNRPSEEIIKEAIERQKKARAYEIEYARQLQEGKDPYHKTVEQILKEAEQRLHDSGDTGTGN